MYFVLGDDSDNYRTNVRNDIRTWLNTIQSSPTLSAATSTGKSTQAGDPAASRVRQSSDARPGTPPQRPDTPQREGSTDEHFKSAPKDKASSQTPEYLIVVITPPENSAFSSLSANGNTLGRTSPLPPTGAVSLGASSSDAATDRPATKTGLGRFYSSTSTPSSSSKNNIVDKVRADFSTSRKDRVVHLARLPTLSVGQQKPSRYSHIDPTIFADLTTRLKECVAVTFDAAVGLQEEAVMREYGKRDVPGWNFNKWMAGVECLANTFEGVGLHADALAQYDDIETVFRQSFEDRRLPFFFRIGGTSPGDDSASLFDIAKKPYRDLILRNEITLFDFRCYLFAKRANLLGKLGRISQVMTETPSFLTSVARMLRGETLPKHFVESWVFSSSLDVVEQCQAWLIERGDVRAPGMDDQDMSQSALRQAADRIGDAQLSSAFHAAKAELLDLALRQLDKIGISAGHLPNTAPFSLSMDGQFAIETERELPPLPDNEKHLSAQANVISRQELLDAIKNREVFDIRYIALAERVLTSFVSGRKKRNVLRLRCVLSSLDYFRGRYAKAFSSFASLSEAYADADWLHVEALHLARHLACHEKLEKPLDRAWVSVVLSLLKARISDMKVIEHDSSTSWLDGANLYSILQKQSKSFEQEVPISCFEPLEVYVSSQPTQPAYAEEDGAQLMATVENHTSAKIRVDDVRVCIIDGQGRELWFTSGKTSLVRGRSLVRVICPACSDAGIYTLDVTQIRLGKIIFQYAARQKGKEVPLMSIARRSTLIHVREDGDQFDMNMDWMPHVHLDRSRMAVLRIDTGRNKATQVVLRVAHRNGGRPVRGTSEARLHKTKLTGSATLQYDKQSDAIVLTNLAAHTKYAIFVPFHEVQGVSDGLLHIIADAEYWSSPTKAPSMTASRRIRRESRLSVGLPLGVNVQDFFRHECLLSKFLVSAGNNGPLCLGSVELRSDEEEGTQAENKHATSWTITTPPLQPRCAVTVDEPASCAFAIRRNTAFKGRERCTLRLTLAYRTAYEEGSALLLQALDGVCSENPDLPPGVKRCIQGALVRRIQTDTNVEHYADEQRVSFQPFDERAWRRTCRQWGGITTATDLYHVVDILRQVFVTAGKLAKRVDSEGASSDAERRDTQMFIETPEQLTWRRLSLPVEVPTMDMVNAVTIRLEEQVVKVGVPVKATIDIATTFRWEDDAKPQEVDSKQTQSQAGGYLVPSSSDAESVSGRTNQDEDTSSDFQDADYDVGASPKGEIARKGGGASNANGYKASSEDANQSAAAPRTAHLSVDIQCDFVHWLLVGAKRAVINIPLPFSSAASVANTVIHRSVTLSLVALQSGPVPLPGVSIWLLSEPALDVTPPSNVHRKAAESGLPASTSTGSSLAPQPVLSCDSYVTNEAERVHVLPRYAQGLASKLDHGNAPSALSKLSTLASTVPRETYWVSW